MLQRLRWVAYDWAAATVGGDGMHGKGGLSGYGNVDQNDLVVHEFYLYIKLYKVFALKDGIYLVCKTIRGRICRSVSHGIRRHEVGLEGQFWTACSMDLGGLNAGLFSLYGRHGYVLLGMISFRLKYYSVRCMKH